MQLEPDEKIDSWDVVVKTNKGREIPFVEQIERTTGDLSYQVTRGIDQLLERHFPCTWQDD